jgi:hypothetical protein
VPTKISYYKRACEIISEAKCSGKPETYEDGPKASYFFTAARLAAKNYGKKAVRVTKFCQNCLNYIQKTSDTLKFVANENITVVKKYEKSNKTNNNKYNKKSK